MLILVLHPPALRFSAVARIAAQTGHNGVCG
jgi:hypothetical protein